ncbi:MAG: NADH-quinone oxidoreductase subunit D [Planctomycetes bacterium]|nr:NADH-quinone oxidoreductase subunit D [Planctomycetota bacterium]
MTTSTLIPTKASGEHLMEINIGPQHPATHGTLRLRIKLDGETVVSVDPEIGYLHTGFEKLGEHRSYNQFVTVTDRMNYLSPICNNVAFSLAAEKIYGIEAPERATLLRVIFCELTRIADHIVCVGLQGMDLGAFSVFLWAFEMRERLYDMFEALCGARLTTSWTRVGGVAFDMPEGMDKEIIQWCADLPAKLDEVEYMLTKNRIFLDRTRGISVLTKEDIKRWGITGPVARASGVDYDVRKDFPYMGYETFDFKIPTREEGDVYSRYKVRIEEMRQSLEIVLQALSRLKPGPVLLDDFKMTLPDKELVYTRMEELIHHFKGVMPGHGPVPSKGEAYVATEAPNGELGFYLISDGTAVPYRVRVRPPSLLNYQAFHRMVEGHMISDVIACLSSINVIAGELDR